MKTIKDLEEIGFKKAGNWFLNENKISFNIKNELLPIEDVLYVFESEGVVKYIGITERSLRARMINYKSGHEENKTTGITNRLVNKNIKNLLINQNKVFIYILKGEALCDFFGYNISLSTGIEKSLIKSFDYNSNLWNSRGVKNQNSSKTNSTKLETKIKNISKNQTIVNLGTEAYNKGFISFKNEIDHLLPLESEGMDIHYKDIKISGWFTRSYQNKKVNGYSELKEILNRDFNINDRILVTVLNPNEIKIEKYLEN
jgi:hypothetical protein